jgi:hypothetical protein
VGARELGEGLFDFRKGSGFVFDPLSPRLLLLWVGDEIDSITIATAMFASRVAVDDPMVVGADS